MSPAKMGKQFGQAEYVKARAGVIIGSEFPRVSVKDLLKRSEEQADVAEMLGLVQAILDSPLEGPLIA